MKINRSTLGKLLFVIIYSSAVFISSNQMVSADKIIPLRITLHEEASFQGTTDYNSKWKLNVTLSEQEINTRTYYLISIKITAESFGADVSDFYGIVLSTKLDSSYPSYINQSTTRITPAPGSATTSFLLTPNYDMDNPTIIFVKAHFYETKHNAADGFTTTNWIQAFNIENPQLVDPYGTEQVTLTSIDNGIFNGETTWKFEQAVIKQSVGDDEFYFIILKLSGATFGNLKNFFKVSFEIKNANSSYLAFQSVNNLNSTIDSKIVIFTMHINYKSDLFARLKFNPKNNEGIDPKSVDTDWIEIFDSSQTTSVSTDFDGDSTDTDTANYIHSYLAIIILLRISFRRKKEI